MSSRSVDPLRQFRLELGLVDSRISRSVDDNVGFQTPNRAGQAGPIGQIAAQSTVTLAVQCDHLAQRRQTTL